MYYKHLIFIFIIIKHVYSLYTCRHPYEHVVQVGEDIVRRPYKDEDVRPGYQGADCMAMLDDQQLLAPGVPPDNPYATQPAREGADPSNGLSARGG